MTNNTRASRAQGPDRGKGILNRAFSLSIDCFDEQLPSLLDTAHRQFFLEAEKATSQHDQGRLFEALKAIEQHRDTFVEHFSESLRQLFERLDHTPTKTAGPPDELDAPANHDQMRLVDDERLERSLTITHVSARIKMRFPMALHALKQRFAVLASVSPDALRNPLGADELGEALFRATQTLKLASHAEVAFFRLFEQRVMPALGELYDDINDMMVEAGVLPNIAYQSARKPGSLAPGAKKEATPHGGDRPGNENTHTAPASDADIAAKARETEQLIQHIHQLLESGMQRTAREMQGTPVAPQAVSQALSSIAQQVRSRPRFEPPQSRQMLMSALRRQISQTTGTPEQDIALPAAQSASVDLIGRLFEQVSSDSVMRPNTLRLLGPLQVPLTHLALERPDCLSDDNQAARQVMTAVAELSNLLPEADDRRDRGNHEVSSLVSEALREHGDKPEQLFRELAEQLGSYTAARRRKAELAERRQVEASKGREKLIVAREEAREEVHRLLDRYHPGRTMREVLQKCWIDVMALALLRHGRHSDYWAGTLETGEIIAAIDSQGGDNTEWQPDFNARWQPFLDALDTGLKLIGLFPEGIERLHKTLLQAREWQLAGGVDKRRPPSLDEGFQVKAQHVGDGALSAVGARPGREANRPRRKVDLATLPAGVVKQLEAIRQLPFGTWFDIEMPNGTSQRVKLAWHSTQTGHCLFVNHRGAKCGTDDVADLARLMHDGRAHPIPPEQHRSLLDRALHAIRRQLGKLTGKLGDGEARNEQPSVG